MSTHRSGRANPGCFCSHCTNVRETKRLAKIEVRAKGLADGDPRHGLTGYYSHGCTCPTCKAAYKVAYEAKKASR